MAIDIVKEIQAAKTDPLTAYLDVVSFPDRPEYIVVRIGRRCVFEGSACLLATDAKLLSVLDPVQLSMVARGMVAAAKTMVQHV